MNTQRLHFAKQLVHSTSLPFIEISSVAGFKSVRRFNEAFRERYRVSPTEMRRKNNFDDSRGLRLEMAVRLPYDWQAVYSYLSRHECYGVEQTALGEYRRFIPLQTGFGTIVVSDNTKRGTLSAEFINVPLRELRYTLLRLKYLFDTDHNPATLPTSTLFASTGVRVPGSFDPFETAVSIILSQLVSTPNAKLNLKNLVERYGTCIGEYNHQPVFKFPTSKTLATAEVEVVGITKMKGNAIRNLATALLDRTIDFNAHLDFSEVHRALLSLKGIGPWTASIIAMRCLGNPDAFPTSDLIVKRALQKKLFDPEDWRSSRAYLTHHIWRDLADTSLVSME